MVALKAVRTAALALATACATACVVLVPSGARADSWSGPDAAGDVTQVNLQAETTTQAPARTEGDVVSSGVSHRKRTVVMAMRYRELTTTGAEVLRLFRIGTPTRARVVSLVARPGHWQGAATMRTGAGKTVACRGMRWSIGYAENLVRLSVPRRCLGRPAWVHVGMLEKHYEDTSNFLDDARTSSAPGVLPVWGPRVRR